LRQINMAMWALLKDRLGVTDADLMAYVEKIQSEAPASKLMECPACHRKILSNSVACIYCGAKTVVAGSFQST
jgi:DNA-directed RNA polymerase subunit RPC12/RpoP